MWNEDFGDDADIRRHYKDVSSARVGVSCVVSPYGKGFLLPWEMSAKLTGGSYRPRQFLASPLGRGGRP